MCDPIKGGCAAAAMWVLVHVKINNECVLFIYDFLYDKKKGCVCVLLDKI